MYLPTCRRRRLRNFKVVVFRKLRHTSRIDLERLEKPKCRGFGLQSLYIPNPSSLKSHMPASLPVSPNQELCGADRARTISPWNAGLPSPSDCAIDILVCEFPHRPGEDPSPPVNTQLIVFWSVNFNSFNVDHQRALLARCSQDENQRKPNITHAAP